MIWKFNVDTYIAASNDCNMPLRTPVIFLRSRFYAATRSADQIAAWLFSAAASGFLSCPPWRPAKRICLEGRNWEGEKAGF